MSLDGHDRRSLLEVAIVVAAAVGVLGAALLIATPLAVGTILVACGVLWLGGVVAVLLAT